MSKGWLAFWFTALVIFLTLVGSCTVAEANKQGSEYCYRNFPNAYSWRYIRPQLNEMWKDKKLTTTECDEMQRLYQEALTARAAEQMDAKLRKYR